MLVSLSGNDTYVSTSAVVERAHSHRARSGGKGPARVLFPFPPPSWVFQKQSHRHLLSLDPGPTESSDDFPS